MKVGFIGSGKVANNLAIELYKKEQNITHIYSRNIKSGKVLANKVQAKYTLDNKSVDSSIDILIIAVNDDNIESVIKELPKTFSGIVCHTSGAISSAIIAAYGFDSGIFYPLYSFHSTSKINISKVPFLITAAEETTKNVLKTLALILSKKVYEVTDEERKYIHLAAVFANNFGNHLMTKAFDILDDKGINKELLLPIIEQSGDNWKNGLSKSIQTGPAIRNDQKTIDNHHEINEDKFTREIYKVLTKSIQDYYL